MPDIATCPCFDTEGEEPANFYIRLIPNSSVGRITRYADGECDPRARC